jgi:hypothetical protein
VVVGFSTLIYLPDTPMQAKWLSDDEKVALLQHARVNQTGIRNSKFNFRQILEAVLDVQVWLFCLMVALVRSPFSGHVCYPRKYHHDTKANKRRYCYSKPFPVGWSSHIHPRS